MEAVVDGVAFGDFLDLPLHCADVCFDKGSENGHDKVVQWLGVETNNFLPKVESQKQQD